MPDDMKRVHDGWAQLSRLKLPLAAMTAITEGNKRFLETAYKTDVLTGEQQSYSSKELRMSISAKLWLDEAKKIRILAENLGSEEGRPLLLEIAETYERFASEILS
jgi:hypothetical protein